MPRRPSTPASHRPARGGARPRLVGRLLSASVLCALLCCSSPASPQERPEPRREPTPPRAPSRPAEAPGQAALRPVAQPALSAFTPEVVANLRRIRARSDRRQDDVFMKVGDSSTVSRGFLECFADPDEVVLPGGERDLAETLEHFRGGNAGDRDPFRRASLAAAEGWSARHVLRGNPPPVLAEVRAARPRFAFVMNGGNDVEGRDDYQYAERMLRIVELLSANGVIPILNSLPPRTDSAEADRWVRRYNQVSWAIARALSLPYLDYHQVMRRLPRQGLAGDGVHPNILVEGGRGHACRLDRQGLRYGHNARNLLALRGLDRLRRTVVEGQAAPDPAPASLQGSGTVAAPFEVLALPFAELRDTSREGSDAIDAYPGCGAEQDESGNELVYRLVVDRPTRVRAVAVGRSGTDVDVHLLRGEAGGAACVSRDDHQVQAELTPGTWYVTVDTFVQDGEPRAGEVLVLIAPG